MRKADTDHKSSNFSLTLSLPQKRRKTKKKSNQISLYHVHAQCPPSPFEPVLIQRHWDVRASTIARGSGAVAVVDNLRLPNTLVPPRSCAPVVAPSVVFVVVTLAVEFEANALARSLSLRSSNVIRELSQLKNIVL